MLRSLPAGALLLLTALVTGCGAASTGNCVSGMSFLASPATAAADHAAASPGNQQQFQVTSAPIALSGSCALPLYIFRVFAAWSNPDPLDIDISSAADSTNGLATCKGPTAGAVALTASSGTGTAARSTTVQLTCK